MSLRTARSARSSHQIELPVRYYRHCVDLDKPNDEAHLELAHATFLLDLRETALVLVDCWNDRHNAGWIKWAARVTREQIAPVLQALRQTPATIVHAPSPAVAPAYSQWVFDSRHIGGYLDSGHLPACGEPFEFATAVVSDQLRIVGLKDSNDCQFVRAGQGKVAWDRVFAILVERGFDGPFSVHAEYSAPSPEAYERSLPEEIAFFKRAVAAAGTSAARS